MSNWEPYSQHKKIHIDKRFRIGSCAFPQHIVRNFRRLSCAHGSASYHAHSAVDGAEIPQSMVRKFRTIGAFPQHIMRFPHDRCISAAYHAISAGHYALPQVAVRKFRTVRFGNLYLYGYCGKTPKAQRREARKDNVIN